MLSGHSSQWKPKPKNQTNTCFISTNYGEAAEPIAQGGTAQREMQSLLSKDFLGTHMTKRMEELNQNVLTSGPTMGTRPSSSPEGL